MPSTKLIERADVKAVDVETQNEIEFYALAFSKTPDKQGDIIGKDAVDEWLAKFYLQGFPLPISFAHGAVKDSSDPFAIVGYAPADPAHVWKDDYGLRVRALLDTGSNETAQQVYMLTKRGIITGASVAYSVPPGGERRMRDGSTLIERMELLECGPCLEPANPDAFVIAVKTAEVDELAERMEADPEEPPTEPVSVKTEPAEATAQVLVRLTDYEALKLKAGRRHSKATRAKMEQVRALLDELLAEDVIDEPAASEAKANSDEPTRAKEDEPKPTDWLREAIAEAAGE